VSRSQNHRNATTASDAVRRCPQRCIFRFCSVTSCCRTELALKCSQRPVHRQQNTTVRISWNTLRTLFRNVARCINHHKEHFYLPPAEKRHVCKQHCQFIRPDRVAVSEKILQPVATITGRQTTRKTFACTGRRQAILQYVWNGRAKRVPA